MRFSWPYYLPPSVTRHYNPPCGHSSIPVAELPARATYSRTCCSSTTGSNRRQHLELVSQCLGLCSYGTGTDGDTKLRQHTVPALGSANSGRDNRAPISTSISVISNRIVSCSLKSLVCRLKMETAGDACDATDQPVCLRHVPLHLRNSNRGATRIT